jgi:DNA-binding MarR family transcriptional regulator
MKKNQDQPTLFQEPPPQKIRDDFPVTRPQARTTDPDTSKIWAKYLDVEGKAAKCILCLYHNGPMHSYKCADLIRVTIADVSSIFTRLLNDGLVVRIRREENKWVSELTPLGREFALRLIRNGGK